MAIHPISRMQEISRDDWLAQFKSQWYQGQHVEIIGPTGTGKTTIAVDILDVREYVCVLAVKRKDETLDLFKKQGYKVIKKWPPDLHDHKVIFWHKPQSLTDDLNKQAVAIHGALNKIYLAGGWCIYFDEAGYIAGTLGLGKDLTVLLNQGRSAYLSVVATMTRPTSVVARVPKEALNQPRHKIIFKYTNDDEMKACSKIADISHAEMRELMALLEYHKNGKQIYSDFLYIGEQGVVIVRNTKGGK